MQGCLLSRARALVAQWQLCVVATHVTPRLDPHCACDGGAIRRRGRGDRAADVPASLCDLFQCPRGSAAVGGSWPGPTCALQIRCSEGVIGARCSHTAGRSLPARLRKSMQCGRAPQPKLRGPSDQAPCGGLVVPTLLEFTLRRGRDAVLEEPARHARAEAHAGRDLALVVGAQHQRLVVLVADQAPPLVFGEGLVNLDVLATREADDAARLVTVQRDL